MAKNIEPKLKKIGDYLKLSDEEALFIIPEYQRAYSWQIANCDKLWQDIIDFSENGRRDSYFFGTIIINCDQDRLELIDGQQRTTTFLLLLKALLIRINTAIETTPNDEDSAKIRGNLRDRRKKIMEILYRVETDDIPDNPDAQADREIYQRPAILKNESINERYRGDLSAIMNASDFEEAKNKVFPIPYKRKDNKYTNYFRNFKFFYEKFDEEPMKNIGKLNSFAKTLLEGCEVIEIRSWEMSQAINMFNSLNSDGLPLYDSDIISAKLYGSASRLGKVGDYSKLWTELKDQITALEELGISDINGILMQYMYYVRTVNGETVTANGTVNVTTPGLRRYFTDENKALIADPVATCSDMLRLVKIWRKIADFESVKLLLKFNENAKLFLASYLLRYDEAEIAEEDTKEVAECLMRLFAALELVDSGYSSKLFKIFLFGEEKKLADRSVSVEELKADFSAHLNGNFDRDKLLFEAKEYDGNMLVYLNEYLFAKEKKVSFVLGTKYDIEHIMPQSGNNRTTIRQDANIADADEFNAVVNKLGNKILLEEKINRSIGNEWFRTKISTRLYERTGYIDSKYPIAAYLVKTYQQKNQPFWTKDDISAATDKAAERIINFIFEK